VARPETEEIRDLLHDLREPVGAFVIYLSLLDDEEVSPEARRHLEAMLASVKRMVEGLARITARFGIETATPLGIVAGRDRMHRVRTPTPGSAVSRGSGAID
jgi:hypothetical protein